MKRQRTASVVIRSILNSLAGKFSEDTRKKGNKGAKTGTSHDWRGFYLSQNDWLKGSHMTKVVGFRMKLIIHTANLCRQILPIQVCYLLHGASTYGSSRKAVVVRQTTLN